MPCDRYVMPRKYTHIVFDPPSAHYVGASAITVPFQIYDEEGEILLGPQGTLFIYITSLYQADSQGQTSLPRPTSDLH
jgi:hypothetical protein